MKRWPAALIVAAALLAGGASTASGRTAATRSAAGSCPGSTVPAVVDATFVCLDVGAACSRRFGSDYAKFGFACAAGHLARRHIASGPALADVFLNTKPRDLTTRASAFKAAGPPPVLHLTFRQPLSGKHKLSISVHNTTIGATTVVSATLQSGWQYTYEVLPAAASDSVPGAYRIAISIDGTGRKELSYSVKR
jgi:hypothetical protein